MGDVSWRRNEGRQIIAAGETREQYGEAADYAQHGQVVTEPATAGQAAPSRASSGPVPESSEHGPRSEHELSSEHGPFSGHGPFSEQQRAHRVLGELLDQASAQNLPAIDWRVAAFEARLTGRCTAYPGPGRRRADFEAWRAALGADATEDVSDEQTVRLTARTERDEGMVTIEITADLYDDIPGAPMPPAEGRNWRSP